MNNWIPLDNYHQKPKVSELVILSDGKDIYYDMVWLNAFTHSGESYKDGWYHVNGAKPVDINPTHWLVLELPK